MNRKLFVRVVGTIVLGWAVTTGDAGAAGPQDVAAAQKLYEEARQLAAQGSYAAACPKFEASQRLDPGMGTMFNLAHCYENIGRTASAWAMFLEVARTARAAGETQKEKVARDRASALEKTLSYLIVAVPDGSDASGLQVSRDGSAVDRGTWGTALPVDQGLHRIEATAPGKVKWSGSVQVAKAGATVTVTIPNLEAVEAAPIAPAPSTVSPSGGSDSASPPAETSRRPDPEQDTGGEMGTQHWLGVGVGGLGVVSLGVAGLFGMQSSSRMDDSSAYCDGDDCSQPGVDLRDQAVSKQNLAYVTAGLGGALMVTGAVLFFTAPSQDEHSSGAGRGNTRVAVGPTGLLVSGVW